MYIILTTLAVHLDAERGEEEPDPFWHPLLTLRLVRGVCRVEGVLTANITAIEGGAREAAHRPGCEKKTGTETSVLRMRVYKCPYTLA